MAAAATALPADLVSFLPRLTLEWLRDRPDELWLEREGTLAFVDISGFTAMSEQLSSRGKAGAEEVTEIMNATFAALLEVAYGEGGGLLKFGGDALLLFYDGDDHTTRAARSAFAMRRLLRTIGRPRTSAGAVTLRMHAGLHTGRFHFFLVGDSHRELLVSGPSATRTVEMEATSEAGEIVVSPEMAALLDAAVLGDEKGAGRLLQGEPPSVGTFVPLPDAGGIPLETAIPAPLRAQLLQVGPLEGEHRNAAVAFLRFRGIDDVIRSEGPESAADALDALVRAVQTAADDHKVTFLESDVDRDGGRIILVAGAPQTFADDEERLLRTLRAAVDTGLPFPVHIGASRGRIFAGQVGASFRRTYTLLGDTAALAARLMARAGEDEIWVAAEAFARGGGRFAATELEPFQVKGKAESVRAVMLGELTAAPDDAAAEAARDRKLPFVDRERERAVLGAAVAPVRMGYGTLVELIGEPGIGKSRLAEELEGNCAGMAKINARCDQYEATTPYYPFRPLLRSLLDVELGGDGGHNGAVLAERLAAVDEELVPWAPLLGAPLDVEVDSTPEVDDLDPAFWRARLHGVVGKLLGGLLDAPTLLLFEDVHWMDDASAELLRYLGTQLATRPWLACTTRRPGDGGFAAAAGTPPLAALTLRLEPIPEEDAKTLVRAAAGDRVLEDDELAALMNRGAGNPLFLQELAASDVTGSDADQMPESVEALVAARIDKLDPGDRALLRWASVLGVSFSGSLIADVLEDDSNVAAASDAWERLGEFVEMDPDVPGGFRFRHALIRDAAYEGLSYKRRRDLHARVAEVMEGRAGEGLEDAAELLSLHFLRAERWPETWRYSVAAGRDAERKYANVEAAQFFERALDAAAKWGSAPADEVAGVWEALGDARMRTGDYERAGAAYRAARKAARIDVVEQARMIQKEATAALRLARYADALRRLKAALRALENVEGVAASAQRARTYGWYSSVLHHQRRPKLAIEWCERTIAEAERSGARDALAHGYRILDWAYMALGRTDEAVHSERAAEIYEELGNFDQLAWVLNNLGGWAFLDGRWDDALAYVRRAREAWEKIGDEPSALIADYNMGQTLADQGRVDEAEPLLRRVSEVWRTLGNDIRIALVASALGRTLARAGRHDEARELLEEARVVFEREEEWVELLTTEARMMESLVLEGGNDDALPRTEALIDRAERIDGVSVQTAMLHRLRGWALLQNAGLDTAEASFSTSLAILRSPASNFGIESVDYDTALTLHALVQVRRLTGGRIEDLELERDAIVARLGLVSLAEPRR